MTMNTTYQIRCNLCPDDQEELRSNYIGCTGRSLHCRSNEHKRAIEKGNKKNAMAKHFNNHHPNNRKDEGIITTKILAKHHSTLTRVIDEGLRLIGNQNLANSKGEWGRGGGLVRLVAHSTQQSSINLDKHNTDVNNPSSNSWGPKPVNMAWSLGPGQTVNSSTTNSSSNQQVNNTNTQDVNRSNQCSKAADSSTNDSHDNHEVNNSNQEVNRNTSNTLGSLEVNNTNPIDVNNPSNQDVNINTNNSPSNQEVNNTISPTPAPNHMILRNRTQITSAINQYEKKLLVKNL